MAQKIEMDDSTDAEKIDYIYRRMRAQERQEIAGNVWKWVIRAIIVVSLAQAYFMFSGLMKSGLSWNGIWPALWLPGQEESAVSKILNHR